MIWVYVLALVFAGGVLAMQLLFSHGDAGGDPELEHAHDLDIGFWPMMTSLRFWTFALLAAGVFGTLSTLFGGPPVAVAVVAVIAGVGSGALATVVVRRLAMAKATQTIVSDAIGKIGRVIVALDSERPGRVRIELRGEMHDLMAVSREPMAIGESVIVESVERGVATVSRAPIELRLPA